MAFDQDFSVSPEAWLRRVAPDEPVFFFMPAVLRATAARFLRGFPGTVTYAVKANPAPAVLDVLAAAGIAAFDVASPARDGAGARCLPGRGAALPQPGAQPVRDGGGTAPWRRLLVGRPGRANWTSSATSRGRRSLCGSSCRCRGRPMISAPSSAPTPEDAAALLRRGRGARCVPSLTFHPGTQCAAPEAWVRYIHAAADGRFRGGHDAAPAECRAAAFAADRDGAAPDLEAIFAAIGQAAREAFGTPPRAGLRTGPRHGRRSVDAGRCGSRRSATRRCSSMTASTARWANGATCPGRAHRGTRRPRHAAHGGGRAARRSSARPATVSTACRVSWRFPATLPRATTCCFRPWAPMPPRSPRGSTAMVRAGSSRSAAKRHARGAGHGGRAD